MVLDGLCIFRKMVLDGLCIFQHMVETIYIEIWHWDHDESHIEMITYYWLYIIKIDKATEKKK